MILVGLLNDEKEEEIQIQKAKHRKFNELAMKGNLASLLQLLHDDPLILNAFTSSSSISETPLHVAALLGHYELTKELLSRKPEFAGSLNSRGSSALHLASAKGYLEIVKELVLVNVEMGFVLDRDGRSPLHLAAIKGRVGVLTELIRVDPEVTRVLTSRGETCLHLCVKHNRLEALKMLVEGMKKDMFVNWKDEDGNTILHVAVAKKQIEIIKYLLINTEIEVNSRNAYGFTALDVLSQSQSDLRDMEIKHCLNGNTSQLSPITPPQHFSHNISTIKQQPKKHKHRDWLGRKRSSLMIVASLLATVAFQAGLSPPGGVWATEYKYDSNGKEVNNPHDVGTSVMAYNLPTAYGQFMIFNTIAFLASLSIIMLLVSGLPMKRRRWMWTQMVAMWIALTAQTITYFLALIHMTPNKVDNGLLYEVTKISVLGWLSMMGLVLIGNLVRVIRYLLRKYGYMEEEQKEDVIYDEEEENDEL